MAVKKGDLLFFPESSGAILSVEDGVVTLLISERDVLAIEPSIESDEVPLWEPRPPKAS